MSQENNDLAEEDTWKRGGGGVREGHVGGADGRRRRQEDWRVRAFKGTKGGIIQYLVPSTNPNTEITECPASPIAASKDDHENVAAQHAGFAASIFQAPTSPMRPTVLNLLSAHKAQTPPQRKKLISATSPPSFPGPTQMWARTPSMSPQPRRCSSEWQSDKENLSCTANSRSALGDAEIAGTVEHPRAAVRSRGCNASSLFARVQAPPSPLVPRCMWGRKRSRSRNRSESNSPVPGPTQMWGCLSQSAASAGAASQLPHARPPPYPSLEDKYSISPTMPFHAGAPGACPAAGAASQPAPTRPPPGPSLEERYSISPTMPFFASAPGTDTAAGGALQPAPTRLPPGPSLEERYSISPTMPFFASAPDTGAAKNLQP